MKALYYPHTEIRSEIILKNALLLWDSVETIVPWKNWDARGLPDDKVFREGYELVVTRRVASPDDKHAAEREIIELAGKGTLQRLADDPFQVWRDRRLLMYPEKFLPETWHRLAKGGFAEWDAGSSDYAVPAGIGFMMMSVLADKCAGTQFHKVTDRGEAYAFVSAKCAEDLGAQRIAGFGPDQIAPGYDRLAEISLSVLDARKVPLKNLVALRKREAKETGGDFQRLRHAYHELLKKHVERIGKEAKSDSDRKELEHEFRRTVSNGLADIKKELGVAKFDALFSKDVVIPALFLAGLTVGVSAAMDGLTKIGWAGVIPLANAARTYRNKRKDLLRKHQMSWLYLAQRQ